MAMTGVVTAALTVVCAQATGMPVVVTPFAGAERSVIDRKTGLFCEYDPYALRDRLVELIEDHELGLEIGRAAGGERNNQCNRARRITLRPGSTQASRNGRRSHCGAPNRRVVSFEMN